MCSFLADNVSSKKCDKPLGVEDGRIPDTAITSSSDVDYRHRASNGRLNFEPRNDRTGAWSARKNDVHQWLQVDFAQAMAIKRVSTQGRSDDTQWVRSYTLSYSQDGVFQFLSFRNNQVRLKPKRFLCLTKNNERFDKYVKMTALNVIGKIFLAAKFFRSKKNSHKWCFFGVPETEGRGGRL